MGANWREAGATFEVASRGVAAQNPWLAAWLTPALLLLWLANPASAEVKRRAFSTADAYLVLEILDDDLVHLEFSTGMAPDLDQPLYTSPMVDKNNYPGPSAFAEGAGTLETLDLRLQVDPLSLCVGVVDTSQGDRYLTTICPVNLAGLWKGFDFDPGATEHAYGLGQQFDIPGWPDGDWTTLGIRDSASPWGNTLELFNQAAVGNVQIPVLYAVGPGGRSYALFVDSVYKQRWDFTLNWWQVRMFGDQVRMYLMAGPDLPDLRSDYLELTGRPPIPPRKAFGLWVSEFSYDNWGEIDDLLAGLRTSGIPVDGFILDLNWFGGITYPDPSGSRMGDLDWDRSAGDGNPYFFPDPETKIQQLALDHVGVAAIEESYLADTSNTFFEMPPELSSYQRTGGICDHSLQSEPITDVTGFWGVGRMIDWSDPAAGDWIHTQRRNPNLSMNGVTVHWIDLGEPESFDPAACYDGVEVSGAGRKNEHQDIHNLYNLLWTQSIWRGYEEQQGQVNRLGQVNPRPLILSRSGTSGIQRYGAAMWSGDIASNLASLSTHLNAQMHMSFSGIDYFGADVGGFVRSLMPYNDLLGGYRGYESEMYTQWLANGSWFDIPVRPHTANEFAPISYHTAPHLVGELASNVANLRQRYELVPYYYSLAWRAHRFGAPVVAPLVFYYPRDPEVRTMGHEKLVGKDLLVAAVAFHGTFARDVYLPAGRWFNYHSRDVFDSSGGWLQQFPTYLDGVFRLPVFARAGAILPMMYVDSLTKDAFGHRIAGPERNELIVEVFAGGAGTQFVLYEDDGVSLDYDVDGRPLYQGRTTVIDQQKFQDQVSILIDAADGSYPEAVAKRNNVIRLVVDSARATRVTLNGQDLPMLPDATAFETAVTGWLNAGPNLILIKSGVADVAEAKRFWVDLEPVDYGASMNFVCDDAWTEAGESILVVGDTPVLGNWDPQQGVELFPSVDYEYIHHPPPDNSGPGPDSPKWTRLVSGLPPGATVQWRCVKRLGPGQWFYGPISQSQLPSGGFGGTAQESLDVPEMPLIFSDGFEVGDSSAWSATIP